MVSGKLMKLATTTPLTLRDAESIVLDTCLPGLVQEDLQQAPMYVCLFVAMAELMETKYVTTSTR